MPYKPIKGISVPDSQQILWRYMDLAKFAALLQKGSLFFPSLNHLSSDDPWEGLPSRLNFEFPEMSNNATLLSLAKNSYSDEKEHFYVHCWHMNDGESDAQWKIYGNNICSLAIVSHYKQICDAITDVRSIYGGAISYYLPHEVTSGIVVQQPLVKRKAYEHEKEFRLVYWDRPISEPKNEGIEVQIDIRNLIERIVISPRAPRWFEHVVTRLIQDYGVHAPVSQSDLLTPLV